ncbi:uncharacterized protein B0I36DRAFT_55335 [Microdochium trichocladiopsis]|uniref:Uncharacterized protein n=1 Tax=Microdochium trichocladiopsis TaxID=1682393 RepID=A0A9P8XQW4_9PEZI|nr:uncharacterized protein B0I36DRAFT_55335 [Microdochium trichocladiopsis]KAH7012308.1 hypothetical protein B0I36DRAFT_55335 [Microdochium trichocladiopsis]
MFCPMLCPTKDSSPDRPPTVRNAGTTNANHSSTNRNQSPIRSATRPEGPGAVLYVSFTCKSSSKAARTTKLASLVIDDRMQVFRPPDGGAKKGQSVSRPLEGAAVSRYITACLALNGSEFLADQEARCPDHYDERRQSPSPWPYQYCGKLLKARTQACSDE